VDLVDRHVDVLVVGIVVAHCDVLVLGESQSVHKALDDMLKLPSVEAPVVGVKRDHEVVRASSPGAGVLRLDGVDECTRELEVISSADLWKIGGVEPSGARLGASPLDVTRKVTEASIRSGFAMMSDDHRCPAKRLTARRTSMTESMSSRFSR